MNSNEALIILLLTDIVLFILFCWPNLRLFGFLHCRIVLFTRLAGWLAPCGITNVYARPRRNWCPVYIANLKLKHALKCRWWVFRFLLVIWLYVFTSSLHAHKNVCLCSGQATKLARTWGKLLLCIYRAYQIGWEKRKQITCSPKTEIFHFYQGRMKFFLGHTYGL